MQVRGAQCPQCAAVMLRMAKSQQVMIRPGAQQQGQDCFLLTLGFAYFSRAKP